MRPVSEVLTRKGEILVVARRQGHAVRVGDPGRRKEDTMYRGGSIAVSDSSTKGLSIYLGICGGQYPVYDVVKDPDISES